VTTAQLTCLPFEQLNAQQETILVSALQTLVKYRNHRYDIETLIYETITKFMIYCTLVLGT
jgi:hypothetical protein